MHTREAPNTFPSAEKKGRPWLRWIVSLAVVGVIVVLARHIDGRALVEAFRKARIGLLLAASLFSVGNLWCKAWVWRTMLPPSRTLTTARQFRYTLAAFSASALAPARAGEALRLWLLRRNHGISFAQSTGVALADKVLDALALLLLAAPLPWLMPMLPAGTARMMTYLALGTVGLLVLAAIAAHRLNPDGVVARYLRQIRILRESGTFARALLACGAAWVFDLATLWVSLVALRIHANFGTAAFTLLAVNLALVIPSTPAGVGTLEASAVVALGLLGVERADAVAFGMLYHAAQLAPLFLLAAVFARGSLRREQPKAALPAAASPAIKTSVGG